MTHWTNAYLTVSHVALLISGMGGLAAMDGLLPARAIAQTSADSESMDWETESRSDSGGVQNSPSIELEQFAPEPSLPPTAPSSGSKPSSSPSIDLSPNMPEFSVSGERSSDYGSTYIDTTDYSLGATPLPSVVLSERSTGCSTVLRDGQAVPNSICGGGLVQSNSSGSASYPSVNSFQVGPLSVGPGGIRMTRSLNINDYYNRTTRPTGLLGNGNSRLMFPLSVPAMITSPFGWRVHPIFGNARFHTGTDLGAPMGTPVVAAYSGRVTIADFLGGYGLTVVLRHDSPTSETLYGHLSEIFVRPGEMINQGDVIGRVGSTGNSTGPHLHFEVRQPTENGWVAINTGDLLQTALANVQGGFQLAYVPGMEDATAALDVPDYLQAGKDATKEDRVDPVAIKERNISPTFE